MCLCVRLAGGNEGAGSIADLNIFAGFNLVCKSQVSVTAL